MSYTIRFLKRNNPAAFIAERSSANDTLSFVASLEQSDCEIERISSPQEGPIGIEMLRLLAKEEAEEMPQASSLLTTGQARRR